MVHSRLGVCIYSMNEGKIKKKRLIGPRPSEGLRLRKALWLVYCGDGMTLHPRPFFSPTDPIFCSVDAESPRRSTVAESVH